MSDDEVRRMGIESVNVDLNLHVGDSIKIINGAFEGHLGEVEEVDEEKEIVKAKVSIFGRETSMEIEFARIDKIKEKGED